MEIIAYYRIFRASRAKADRLENQRDSVRHFAEQQGMLIARDFVEADDTGRKDRPELEHALRLAKQIGATVVIARLDRLAQSVAVLQRLTDSGVPVVAADLPGSDMAGLLAGAHSRRQETSQRTRSALQRLSARLNDGERHVARSGRVIERLGNPFSRPGDSASPASGLKQARAVHAARAEVRTERMRPVIKGLLDSGVTTLPDLAGALNRDGVAPPRGKTWYPSSVRMLLIRLDLPRIDGRSMRYRRRPRI
jgi:hypothetical protein